MRRIGVLMPAATDDRIFQARLGAFLQGLALLGWAVGRNVQSTSAGPQAMPTTFANTRRNWSRSRQTSSWLYQHRRGGLRQATRTVPIVFALVADPVGGGYVESLARPGGNVTGFIAFEYSMGGKWLELLKEIAPRVTRVAVLRDPAIAAGTGQFAAIQAMAPSLGVELSPVDVRDAPEIERAVTAFAQRPNGGLIVTGKSVGVIHRDLIITLAARHNLPAIYFANYFVADSGLISYGPDFSTNVAARPAMSIASSRARSRPICRCKRRPSTSW